MRERRDEIIVHRGHIQHPMWCERAVVSTHKLETSKNRTDRTEVETNYLLAIKWNHKAWL